MTWPQTGGAYTGLLQQTANDDEQLWAASATQPGYVRRARNRGGPFAAHMEYMDARAAGTMRVSALAMQHMLSDADSE